MILTIAKPEHFSYSTLPGYPGGARAFPSETHYAVIGGKMLAERDFDCAQGSDNKIIYFTASRTVALKFEQEFGCADAELKREFESELRSRARLLELSKAVTTDKRFPSPEGYEYRDYQNVGIEYALEVENVLIADGMRVGKTCTALGVINALSAKRSLVVCPSTVKSVWVDHANKWLLGRNKVQMLDTQTPIDKVANVLVTNYDILYRLDALRDEEFDVLVADEVHMAKSSSARRSRALFDLAARKKIGMTGTPLLNKPADLLPVISWLNPFWKDFTARGETLQSKDKTFTLPEAQEELRSTMMVRRTQEQLFEMNQPETRLVVMPVGTNSHLIERENKSLGDMAETRRLLGISKTDYIINHVSVYAEDEKIVVFAHHQAVIKRLITSLGVLAASIYGQSNDAERTRAKERFLSDDSCRVFIGSISAASMGINLSVANRIVFAECDWSSGLMQQAMARCSDAAKMRQIAIEFLVYENSLDYRILQRLEEKGNWAEEATD